MASATADAELLEKDLADPHAAKPASAKKTGKRAAQRSWLGAASHYASSVASGASSLYTNSAPVSANRADSLVSTRIASLRAGQTIPLPTT